MFRSLIIRRKLTGHIDTRELEERKLFKNKRMRLALNLVGEDCVLFFPEVIITKGLLFGREWHVWGISDTILKLQAVFSAEKKDLSINICQPKITFWDFALVTARNGFLCHSQMRQCGRPLLNWSLVVFKGDFQWCPRSGACTPSTKPLFVVRSSMAHWGSKA